MTHDPEEAALLADEILVIDGGRLLQAGPAAQVFARPASARVALLLGIPNLNSGRMLREGVLEAGGVELRVPPGSPPPGEAVSWCVPAEEIRVSAAGPHRALLLDVADVGTGLELTLKLGGLELLARSGHVEGLATGGECRVEVPAGAVRVWPAAQNGAEPAPRRVESPAPIVRD